MSGWVFLVPGQGPGTVEGLVATWQAAPGRERILVRAHPDRLGTLVEVVGPDADDLGPSLRSAVGGVLAPPPVGGPSRPAEPVAVAASVDSEIDDAEMTRRNPGRSRRLRLSDGSVLQVTGRMVIGRDPDPARHGPGVEVVRVDDPQRAVSKTHLALELRAGTLWVEDLGSTNGTTVMTPDGSESEARQGQPLAASAGDTVHFGGLSAVVER